MITRYRTLALALLVLALFVSLSFASTNTSSDQLSIANRMIAGGKVTAQEKQAAYPTYLELVKNARHTPPSVSMTGGPDAGGYYYIDSEEPTWNPLFSGFLDMTGGDVASQGAFTGTDDGSALYVLGFNFPFYGESFNQCYLSTNGSIQFGFADDNAGYNPFVFANASGVYFWNTDGCYFSDAYTTISSKSFSSPNRFVIDINQFTPYYWDTPSFLQHIQIVLYESGLILVHYGNFTNPESFSHNGVGIRHFGTDTNLEYTRSPTAYTEGLSVLYYKATMLPVEMTSFTAHSADNQVTLNWRTESENRNWYFNLYRSTERNEIGELVARVNGRGNSSTTIDYSYVDNQVVNGTTYYYRIADVSVDGEETIHRMIVEATPNNTPVTVVPAKYALSQNYPNPFNPSTEIKYLVGKAGNVKVRVFDMMGTEVATLVNSFHSTGNYSVTFNGEGLPSGSYICLMEQAGMTTQRKMTLLK